MFLSILKFFVGKKPCLRLRTIKWCGPLTNKVPKKNQMGLEKYSFIVSQAPFERV